MQFDIHKRVDVSLSGYSYSITIGSKILDEPQMLSSFVAAQQALIVTNETIAPLYLQRVRDALAGVQCDCVLLPDGEPYKNQESLWCIYDALINNGHHRDTTLIALGGGVVGDITGFAAATYQRGVPYIQIPTTLLAQVDSSVGGKTAINHALGKNMIGSFYQPKAVLIDTHTLSSLPDREFRAGLAEIIKYAFLAGGSLLTEVERLLHEGLTPAHPALNELIASCCRIKASIVAVDEKETGVRALLNLGHTVAHALEAYTQYQYWLHGEAVAIGLYSAAILSYHRGVLALETVQQVERMLLLAQLPHKIPNSFDLMQLKQLMSLDKKVKNGRLRFILIRKPGDCYLEDQITENDVYKALVASVEGI